LTRTGLEWTAKYPSAIAALAKLNVKTAYLDGELCAVDDAGLPSFAHTQAATDEVTVEMQWGSTGRAWMVGRVWGGRREAVVCRFRRIPKTSREGELLFRWVPRR
jgi:hypothetical protein